MNSEFTQFPLISVIVPIYNVELYVDDCVRSLLDQTYKNLEVILVDDGSTDSSSEKCDQYSKLDSRVKVYHQKNGGLSCARNTGLEMCSGEYVSFVDGDDFVSGEYIEYLYGLIVRYKTSVAQVSEREVQEEKSDREEVTLFSSREYLLSPNYKTMAWGKLYAKSLWQDNRFPIGKVHEDNAIIYRVIYNAGNIAVSERVMYFCNVRDDSINTRSDYSLKRLDRLLFDKEAIVFYREKDEKDLEMKAVRFYAYDLLNNYIQITGHYPNEKKLLKELKKEYCNISKELLEDSNISFKTKVLLMCARLYPEVWKIVENKER